MTISRGIESSLERHEIAALAFLYQTEQFPECAQVIRGLMNRIANSSFHIPKYYPALYQILQAICEPDQPRSRMANVQGYYVLESYTTRAVVHPVKPWTQKERSLLETILFISKMVLVHFGGKVRDEKFASNVEEKVKDDLRTKSIKELGSEIFKAHDALMIECNAIPLGELSAKLQQMEEQNARFNAQNEKRRSEWVAERELREEKERSAKEQAAREKAAVEEDDERKRTVGTEIEKLPSGKQTPKESLSGSSLPSDKQSSSVVGEVDITETLPTAAPEAGAQEPRNMGPQAPRHANEDSGLVKDSTDYNRFKRAERSTPDSLPRSLVFDPSIPTSSTPSVPATDRLWNQRSVEEQQAALNLAPLLTTSNDTSFTEEQHRSLAGQMQFKQPSFDSGKAMTIEGMLNEQYLDAIDDELDSALPYLNLGRDSY